MLMMMIMIIIIIKDKDDDVADDYCGHLPFSTVKVLLHLQALNSTCNVFQVRCNHKCSLKWITLSHTYKLQAFTDAKKVSKNNINHFPHKSHQ